MKLLIATVLLAVVQTPAPVPRQATDSTTNTSRAPQKNGKGKQKQTDSTPPASTPIVVETSAPARNDEASQIGDPNTQHSVAITQIPPVTVIPHGRDWVDWGIWIFNGGLLAVGYLQWRVLRRQRDIMADHATHLQKLAKAADANATAAQSNASAALLSAEAFSSKERAQIGIRLRDLVLKPSDIAIHGVTFRVVNFGPTRAFITEANCAAYTVPMENFNLGDETILGKLDLPKIVTPRDFIKRTAYYIFSVDTEEIAEIKADRVFVEIKGIIKYDDVFDEHRETRFRYRWKYNQLLRGEDPIIGQWNECGPTEDNVST
jgi:hypothetical protein